MRSRGQRGGGDAQLPRTAGLLPDPEPRAIRVPIISVDDHLIEPPDLFEGRVAGRLAGRAPRIIEDPDGTQSWLYEDRRYPNIGLNAVIGRPREDWSMDPARFEDMRPGCFDIRARIADMDLNGVWASLCFPSLVAGFCGSVFIRSDDPELGLACLRAWNQWHHEVWAGTYPDRIIPLQLPWLADVALAAAEVRANAELGFKAVSFPEFPAQLGLPVDLHRPLGPVLRRLRGDRDGGVPPHRLVRLGPAAVALASLRAAPHPLPGQRPHRRGRVAVVRGPAPIPRRCRWPCPRAGSAGCRCWSTGSTTSWTTRHPARSRSRGRPTSAPARCCERNFWFCTIDDPSVVDLRHVIGIDHIMVESDYPHADSTWPDTQAVMEATFGRSGGEGAADDRGRQRGPAVPPSPPARDDWRVPAPAAG